MRVIGRHPSMLPHLFSEDMNMNHEDLLEELESLRRRVAELEDAHEQLWQTEQRLQESEDLFRKFFETNVNFCYMISAEGIILDVNASALEALEYKRDELVGQSIATIYAPESRLNGAKTFEKWKRTGRVENEELVILTRAGERRTVLLNAGVHKSRDGTVRSISVQTDITERKQMEQTLAARETQYRTLIENIPDLIVRYDSDLRRTYVNPSWEKASGLSAEEVINVPASDIPKVPRAISPEYAEKLRQVLETGAPQAIEFTWTNARGATLYLEYVIVPEYDVRGSINSVLAVGHDLTERKRVQERLEHSEERLRLTLEATQIGIWDWDVKNDQWYASPVYYTMLGYEPRTGPANRSEWLERLHPEDRAGVYEKIQDVLTRDFNEYQYEARLRHADGTYRWQLVRGFGIKRDGEGKVTRLLGIRMDITERKRADRRLQKESERANVLLELYSRAAELTDKKLYDYALDQAVRLTDSAIGFFHLVSEDQKDVILTTWNREALKSCTASYAEHYPVDQAGNWVDCVRFKSPVVYNDFAVSPNRKGLPQGHAPVRRFMSIPVFEGDKVRIIFGVGNKTDEYDDQDVREIELVAAELNKILNQRRAEEALRESEERFRNMADAAPVMLWMSGVDGLCTFFNQGWLEFRGRVMEQELDNGWAQGVHPKDLDGCLDTYLSSFAKRTDFRMEYRLKRHDGEFRWILDAGVPRIGPGGEFMGYIGSCIDITEIKRSHESVKRQHEFLQNVVESLSHPFYVIDEETREIVMSNSAAGPTPPPAGTTCYKLTHGNDIPCNTREHPCPLEEVKRTRKSVTVEHVHHDIDGRRRNIEIHAYPVFDDNGKVIQVIEYGLDITERKQAEKASRESEQRYKDLFDNSPELICTLDLQGNFTAVNELGKKLIGYSTDEFRGMSFRQIIDPEYLSVADANFRKQVEHAVEQVGPYELLIRTKSLEAIWLEVETRILTEEGKPTGVHASARNVTDRKRAEADLYLLVTAIEQAGEMIFITDSSGTIEYVNPAFEQTTGYTRQEVVGRTPRFLQSGKHDNAFYENLWETISRGSVWHGNFVNKKKDGTIYQEEATISPVIDPTGRITNYVAVKRDVTDKISLQQQLLQAQKMEAVGTLAGGIAHDFNNLLQIMNMCAETALFRMTGRETGYPEMEEIKRTVRSASELTQGLLTFSRRAESKLRPVDLNKELKRLARMLARMLPKMIEIEMSLGETLPTLNADPAQLQQVVLNLAVNARDAMPHGGKLLIETRRIHLNDEYCRAHIGTNPGDHVRLTISDNGIGMDEATRKNIFDPFFTTKAMGQGTGLGLAIVFGIVKNHGGNILCSSELGRGTTFRIYLPVVAGVTDVEETGQFEAFVGGNETILFVDDEASVRNRGAQALRRFGYSVLTASNGKEGLEIYREMRKDIDLVVMDMIMPEMNGSECLSEILKIDPAARIVIASGHTTNGPAHRVIGKGPKATLKKPYGIRQLLNIIRSVIDDTSSQDT